MVICSTVFLFALFLYIFHVLFSVPLHMRKHEDVSICVHKARAKEGDPLKTEYSIHSSAV